MGIEARDVAIVIPQYNQVALTVQAIHSLKGQTALENIFVVDGASTESLEPVILEGVTIVRAPVNAGYGYLANMGIKAAEKRKYAAVLLLNNDVIVAPGALNTLVGALNEAEVNCIVSPVIYDGTGALWFSRGSVSWCKGNVYHVTAPLGGVLTESDFLSGCALLIPSIVIARVGEFDESYFMYYEDADFAERCKLAGVKLLVCHTAMITHLVGSSSSSSLTYYRYAPRNRIRWVRKYAPPWARWLVMLSVVARLTTQALWRYSSDPNVAKVMLQSIWEGIKRV